MKSSLRNLIQLNRLALARSKSRPLVPEASISIKDILVQDQANERKAHQASQNSKVLDFIENIKLDTVEPVENSTLIKEWIDSATEAASSGRFTNTAPEKENIVNDTSLKDRVLEIAADEFGSSIKTLDLRGKADWTNWMVIVEGRNSRHLYKMAAAVSRQLKHTLPMDPVSRGLRNYGGFELEDGKGTCEDWVTLDLNSVIVHFMLPNVRATYDIEGMWENMEPELNITAENEQEYASNFVSNVFKTGIQAQRELKEGEYTMSMLN